MELTQADKPVWSDRNSNRLCCPRPSRSPRRSTSARSRRSRPTWSGSALRDTTRVSSTNQFWTMVTWQPSQATRRAIQSHTDRVLAAIQPDDSSQLAALRAEKSLNFLRRGPRLDPRGRGEALTQPTQAGRCPATRRPVLVFPASARCPSGSQPRTSTGTDSPAQLTTGIERPRPRMQRRRPPVGFRDRLRWVQAATGVADVRTAARRPPQSTPGTAATRQRSHSAPALVQAVAAVVSGDGPPPGEEGGVAERPRGSWGTSPTTTAARRRFPKNQDLFVLHHGVQPVHLLR